MPVQARVLTSAALVALSLLVVAVDANAGGLFFSDRGVRPMGRGGAFVAGADDLGAIYYNPAGIVEAGNQVLADGSFMLFRSSYTRTARIRQYDPNTGLPTGQEWDQTFPKSNGTSTIQPIPTLAISNRFGLKDWAFALGVFSPYAAGARYDQQVAGGPNPGRYMLLNVDGSALVVPGVWAGYAPFDWLSLGIGIQALVGTYRTLTGMTTCLPDRFMCAPEQADYDATTQMSVGPIFSPGASAGVQIKAGPYVRFGASYQLPHWVNSDATVNVRLPSAAVFDNAKQDGDQANVKMAFPWIARIGVEVRDVVPRTRGEVAFVYEAWSMHDQITVTPKGIVLRDVELFPPEYRVGSISVPRGFRDTGSLRFGIEHWEPIGSYQLDTRIGVMLERGAIPKPYMSTLTIDLDKVVLGIGGSLHVNKIWRFDALFAHVFGMGTTVPTDQAAINPVNPVRAAGAPYPTTVNGGRYEASANILGVGMAVNYM
ncbi:MAG: outer membrane protein transport protein [Deltaproteobacteria bacterium]|nr:outer membrane protein transport protein [Deltaproteobacteria bacterium]